MKFYGLVYLRVLKATRAREARHRNYDLCPVSQRLLANKQSPSFFQMVTKLPKFTQQGVEAVKPSCTDLRIHPSRSFILCVVDSTRLDSVDLRE